MPPFVFAAVLFAAAAHAGWNAAIKRGSDPLASTVSISLGSCVVALALVPFTGLPARAAWPWLIGSVIVHLGYFSGLAEAYRTGDMSQVYPLARGSAPIVTAAISAAWLRERLAPAAWVGLACLVTGVIALSLRGGRDVARVESRSVGFALATAATIVAYTILDGVGGRASGNPHGYSVFLFLGCGVVMTLYAISRRGKRAFSEIATSPGRAALGGSLQLASYGIAIWAMTVAPIAMVAALRETSVLFGAVIATVVLREPLRTSRVFAAVIIVIGLIMIRLY